MIFKMTMMLKNYLSYIRQLFKMRPPGNIKKILNLKTACLTENNEELILDKHGYGYVGKRNWSFDQIHN